MLKPGTVIELTRPYRNMPTGTRGVVDERLTAYTTPRMAMQGEIHAVPDGVRVIGYHQADRCSEPAGYMSRAGWVFCRDHAESAGPGRMPLGAGGGRLEDQCATCDASSCLMLIFSSAF